MASQRPIPMDLPLGREPLAVLRRIEIMEHLLERSMTIPGTSRKVGLDALVGHVPIVGDVVTAIMGAYIVWEASNLGLPKWKLWRMAANIAIDTGFGAIPLVGDAFDVLFRSNTRNLRIVRRHLEKHHPLIEQ